MFASFFLLFVFVCKNIHTCIHAHVHTCTYAGRASGRGRHVVCTVVARCARAMVCLFTFICLVFFCFPVFAYFCSIARFCLYKYIHMHTFTCTYTRIQVECLVVVGMSCVRSWPDVETSCVCARLFRLVCARDWFVLCVLVTGSSYVRSFLVRRVCARGRFVTCAFVFATRDVARCARDRDVLCAVVTRSSCVRPCLSFRFVTVPSRFPP